VEVVRQLQAIQLWENHFRKENVRAEELGQFQGAWATIGDAAVMAR
jgi:hypothetical protein